MNYGFKEETCKELASKDKLVATGLDDKTLFDDIAVLTDENNDKGKCMKDYLKNKHQLLPDS